MHTRIISGSLGSINTTLNVYVTAAWFRSVDGQNVYNFMKLRNYRSAPCSGMLEN